MAEPLIKFFYGTEAQILALTPADAKWIEKAFYYPNDKGYFYELLDGVMKKYGAGEIIIINSGVGIRLNNEIIGGQKRLIETHETLGIPVNWEYDVFHLDVDGVIECEGEINIIN